jgi:hypothetical protein
MYFRKSGTELKCKGYKAKFMGSQEEDYKRKKRNFSASKDSILLGPIAYVNHSCTPNTDVTID